MNSVLSKMWLLEPHGQQSPETNHVCSNSASRSCRGRMYLYIRVHACKHMSTCVCICMCVLSLHLETEADVYCLTLCIIQLPRTCLSPALTRGSTRHPSFNLFHHHPFGSPNNRVGVLIVLSPILQVRRDGKESMSQAGKRQSWNSDLGLLRPNAMLFPPHLA